MEIKEIDKFIDVELERLKKYYNLKSDEELTLAMTIKIGEELGELYNEVLAHKGFQRQDKMSKMDIKEIEDEFADVIFTTLLLSRKFNIDMDEALKKKIEKIKSRKY